MNYYNLGIYLKDILTYQKINHQSSTAKSFMTGKIPKIVYKNM